jgi:hypothetical protein
VRSDQSDWRARDDLGVAKGTNASPLQYRIFAAAGDSISVLGSAMGKHCPGVDRQPLGKRA